MLKPFFAVVSMLALGACATAPDLFRMTVIMSNADESEVFLGEAVGPPNDRGAFTMVSRGGLVCEGFYLLSSPTEGEAITRCEDGRTGQFELMSSGLAAEISGEIDGERFSGSAVDRRIVEAAMAAQSQ